jgi:large subunit ribosomal protein L2
MRNAEEAFVTSLEYDPNRSSNIAKVYAPKSQQYSYIIAPKGLKTFDKIISLKDKNKNIRFNVGDTSLLNNFEFGDFLHNVAITPNTKGLLARAAGTYCQLLEHTNDYVKLRLPSGQQRLIPNNCIATLGIVGNEEANLKNLKKAGRSR